MAAMTRDASLGKLVNLTEAKGNQDAYAFVATHLWEDFEAMKSNLTDADIAYLADALDSFRQLFDDFSTQINECNDLELLKKLKTERFALYTEMKEDIKSYAPVHWIKIAPEKKQRRGLVKRGVMTLGYGVTVGGMAQQVVDDFEDEKFERTESILKDWFGRRLFSVCESVLSAVTVVRNCLAEAVSENGEPVIEWTSPSGFPVVMYAYQRKEVELELEDFNAGKIGNMRITRIVSTSEYKKSGAVNGISPNVVHSCDAAHLDMTVVSCDFPITTIHDSFGAAAGNADDLFYKVRECFVRMYISRNVLLDILTELGHADLMPQLGDLDLNAVMDNDFTFA
jgi:DNA-directed RNA polymerase